MRNTKRHQSGITLVCENELCPCEREDYTSTQMFVTQFEWIRQKVIYTGVMQTTKSKQMHDLHVCTHGDTLSKLYIGGGEAEGDGRRVGHE